MPAKGTAMADTLVDVGVQSTIITGLSQETAAASSSRTRRWDQLSEDSASMWAVALTSPTVFAAQGVRMLNGTPGNFGNEVKGTG
jgi:hypothetical protein